MRATSEDLEQFLDRVQQLNTALSKIKTAELTRQDVVNELSTIARMWLRVSPELKNTAEGYIPSLDEYDRAMVEILSATKQRSRVTAYRARLKPFVSGLLDSVVIPLIRYEGSPSQAAARQLESLFRDSVTIEELPYIQEAARCSAAHCHRAAIVLLWAAGISRFHSKIGAAGYAAFNSAAASATGKKGAPFNRITKGLAVNSIADLQRGRDFDAISVGMELWGYDLQAFEEMDRLLSIRNSAAHPGMFTPSSLDVRQFAEKLHRFVFLLV